MNAAASDDSVASHEVAELRRQAVELRAKLRILQEPRTAPRCYIMEEEFAVMDPDTFMEIVSPYLERSDGRQETTDSCEE